MSEKFKDCHWEKPCEAPMNFCAAHPRTFCFLATQATRADVRGSILRFCLLEPQTWTEAISGLGTDPHASHDYPSPPVRGERAFLMVDVYT